MNEPTEAGFYWVWPKKVYAGDTGQPEVWEWDPPLNLDGSWRVPGDDVPRGHNNVVRWVGPLVPPDVPIIVESKL